METKRILISLSLGYGLSVMGIEECIVKKLLSSDDPSLENLTLRTLCRMNRKEALAIKGMTPEMLSAIEKLLREYGLCLGMSEKELDEYLDTYFRENPEEKAFYDSFDTPDEDATATAGRQQQEKTASKDKSWEEMCRDFNQIPLFEGIRLNDLERLRYQTVRELYLKQPFYIRWFCSRCERLKRAAVEAYLLHATSCMLSVYSRTQDGKETNPANYGH